MNPKIQTLLDQVNQVYPGEVMVRAGQEHDEKLHLDRVQQSALANRILIELPDSTEADFLIGNELLKMLLTLNGITPQILFALTFHNEELDQQLIQIATRMHRIVVHAISYSELATQGITTERTVQAYLAGLKSELSPEKSDLGQQALWYLLMVMDALVFAHSFSDGKDKVTAALAEYYPKSYQAAELIVAPLFEVDLKQSRQIRSQMVRIFTAVDAFLEEAGLATVNAQQYVTLTSVLSQRQLDLPVRQVFDIFHTEMYDFRTDEPAYVGLNQQDRQNSFVITPPANEADRPEFFKQLYASKVADLFKQLALPYIERK